MEETINNLVENTLKKENAKEIIVERISWYEMQLLQKDNEIERLNNIIKDIKSQLDYLETYSSKEDVFEDMKRRLDKIENIVNRS